MSSNLSNLVGDSSLKDIIDRLEILSASSKEQKTEYKDILMAILENNEVAYNNDNTVLELINKIKEFTNVILITGGTNEYLFKQDADIIVNSSDYKLVGSVFIDGMRGYARVKTNTLLWSGNNDQLYKVKFESELPTGEILDEHEFTGKSSTILKTSKDLKVSPKCKINIYASKYQTIDMKIDSIYVSYNLV